MNIDVVRTQKQVSTEPIARRVFDVSSADAAEVEAYARTTDAHELYLERKGARTFLIAD
jgi:hypothetical protein